MPTTSWELRLRALLAFLGSEGREPSTRASTPGEHRLAVWLDEQRKAARAGRIDGDRLDKLRSAGLLAPRGYSAGPRAGAAWLRVASIEEFLQEEGRIPSLTSPSCPGEKRLAAWMRDQLSGRSASRETSLALRAILDAAATEDVRVLSQVG